MLVGHIALVAAAFGLPAQNGDAQARRIEISLQDHLLWLIDGSDTVLTAPIAAGRRDSLVYGGKAYIWSTPEGERTIRAKRLAPVWSVPDWHYFERAASEQLELVAMVRGRQYPLADGSRLEVRQRQVIRVLGRQFWRVPQGSELIIDGVLYMPPAGTVQREIPGALGSRALDLGEGFLIHGTSPHNQTSIGRPASHGCIRMHDEDVKRLYELVNVGTTVLIHSGGSNQTNCVAARCLVASKSR